MNKWTDIREFFAAEINGWGRDCAVAGMFLTRLPFPDIKGAANKGRLGAAARAFPLIGVLVGVIGGAALLAAAELDLHPLACALIGLAATVLATGALHEDGLADVADGLGGGDTVEKKLKIMRDSRIGAFGVLAVVFSVSIRAAILGGLPGPGLAAAALVAAAALSRGLLPITMHRLEPARKSGLAVRAGDPDREGWIKAGLLGVLAGFLFLGPWGGLLAAAMAAAAAWFVAWLCQRQMGGYPGDVLGAQQQAAEAAVLMAVAAAL
ncbi:MAG: adenosylcobinamide-GDP ribazoletransferase [Alphaproteobacteria bacterium]|nr:adenosylcobinamide-GDP ribazoletransferase [Alphaproteobacteria bacterium]